MKRLVMLAAALAVPFLAMGQFNLSGKVTDKKTGDPLPGASLKIENTLRAMSCGPDGTFTFSKL